MILQGSICRQKRLVKCRLVEKIIFILNISHIVLCKHDIYKFAEILQALKLKLAVKLYIYSASTLVGFFHKYAWRNKITFVLLLIELSPSIQLRLI
jgi:hypothetical protein